MPSDRIDLPTPDGYFRDVPTYTADTINALRAEVERLRTMPMKYRRMEFNAQLQREADALRAEVARLQADGIHSCHDECPRIACVQRRRIAALEAERDALRRILRVARGHPVLDYHEVLEDGRWVYRHTVRVDFGTQAAAIRCQEQLELLRTTEADR